MKFYTLLLGLLLFLLTGCANNQLVSSNNTTKNEKAPSTYQETINPYENFNNEVVWDGKPKILSEQEAQKAIKLYVDKTYPNEAKKWKEYALNHPKDKYGNEYGIIKSPYTGKIWLDRNLGAKRVCQSFDDSQCYGDYFQWGRDSDGHEKQNSSTTSSLSSTDIPNHSQYIEAPDRPHDWRRGQNGNLWQGINGKNNPCPSGFRVPTIDELLAETTKQGVKNRNDAYRNFLKLPSAGHRGTGGVSVWLQGSIGSVWSSSPSGPLSQYLYFNSSNADLIYNYRAYGLSVRCLREE